jgi:steroid 5-alpha reductase family enzyme
MKILGFAILAVVFAGLFMITGWKSGYIDAAIAWGASIVITSLIFVSIKLIVG